MLREDFAAAWAIADTVLATRDPRIRDDPARPYHERWVWDGRSLSGQHVVVRCYHGPGGHPAIRPLPSQPSTPSRPA